MAFNEAAFRAEATKQGISEEAQNEYLAKQAKDTAFRAEATKQGISEEAQNEYLARQTSVRVTNEAVFAKPDLNLPFSVKEQYRTTDVKGNYVNPMDTYTGRTILGPNVPGRNPDKDYEYEQRIRNDLGKDTVLRIASQIGADPTTQGGINAIYSHAEREVNWKQDKRELLANLQELNNIDRPAKWLKSQFSSAADAEWKSISAQNVENIATLAKERGLDLVHQEGRFYAYDPQGNLQPVTPEFLQSLGKAKYEALGGIAGAVTGARLAPANPWRDRA